MGRVRQDIQELTKHEDLPNPILMSTLRDAIPTQAKSLILGVAEPEEAWKRLERRFGDRNIIIITARQKLLATNMKGSPYEQL